MLIHTPYRTAKAFEHMIKNSKDGKLEALRQEVSVCSKEYLSR
jgi:hypothetical protein